jgi:hypothetical protein
MSFDFDQVVAMIWQSPTIPGLLLVAAVTAYFLWRNNFKSRRAAAAQKFRSSVLRALAGLYRCQSIGRQLHLELKLF